MTKKSDRRVINDLIDAWEKLPGGRNYSPAMIGEWLNWTMAPAINSARRHVKRSVKMETRR